MHHLHNTNVNPLEVKNKKQETTTQHPTTQPESYDVTRYHETMKPWPVTGDDPQRREPQPGHHRVTSLPPWRLKVRGAEMFRGAEHFDLAKI